MIGWAVVSLVNKKVATVGGTVSAISLISDSGIGSGPLGMRDTRPMAEAPLAIASAASAGDATQQIFTRGGMGNTIGCSGYKRQGIAYNLARTIAHETDKAPPESDCGSGTRRVHGQRNLQPESGLVGQLHFDGVCREKRSRHLHLSAWGSGLPKRWNVRGE